MIGLHVNGSALALAGGVIAILLRKRAVGGWLLYFIWQVVLGLGLAIGTTRWNRYLPGAWFDGRQYFSYAVANLSRLILLAALGLIWIVLVKTREWQWVSAMRYALATYAFLTILKLLVDTFLAPENAGLDALSLAFPLVWMVYFGVSRRVWLVFHEKR